MAICDPTGQVQEDASAVVALLDVAAEQPEVRQLLAGIGNAMLRIYATK